MFDLATILWIGVGVAYSILFILDNKVLSKKDAKTVRAS